ncbi:allantoinase [Haematobia irritans]|uniref:allantoinase n=1 Tax=Haematobia irritans TaxID=7368 RepID=UPI003F508886
MDLLFLSKRIYLGTEEGFMHGGIIVNSEGTIKKVLRSVQEVNSYLYNIESEAVFDFENMVLMPGLIDVNVHINEPGRKDWEGFLNATKAAAAGGFTTIIDRPTNSIPPTTSMTALKAKLCTARGKIYVDVGFWGGLNTKDWSEMPALIAGGVIGLQCTLVDSPEPVGKEYPAITKEQLEAVLQKVDDNVLIAVHAEEPLTIPIRANEDTPKSYESFLRTRPAVMEVNAVRTIGELAIKHKKKQFHLLNLSANEVMPIIKDCRSKGAKITAETCPHYLSIAAEDIEDCHTEFKTHPPIRARSNQAPLWESVKTGTIDIIASDHSPATPGPKCLTYGKTRGNFLNAWPGISSLQLGLSVMWTNCQKHGLGMQHIYKTMCENPAILCGLENSKGKIIEGYDADFCIWDPDAEFEVHADMLYSTNKATPYMNQRLRGVVHATVVRGLHVYQDNEGFGQPLGKIVLRKNVKKIVKFM